MEYGLCKSKWESRFARRELSPLPGEGASDEIPNRFLLRSWHLDFLLQSISTLNMLNSQIIGANDAIPEDETNDENETASEDYETTDEEEGFESDFSVE